MKDGISRYLKAATLAVERHGGGWRGMWAVCRRAWKVAGAMGMRGLLARLRRASATRAPLSPNTGHVFPPPAAPDDVALRVGVMAHVFYADLIEEFAEDLSQMPLPYVLLVSVTNASTQALVEQRFGGLPGVEQLIVRVVPNRGRDIAPLLVSFREEILALDVVGHIHTKKSLYTGGEQERWRRYLLTSLFGSRDRLIWIFGMFQAEPRLGMVYPESYEGVPLWAHTWLSNAEVCEQLAARLGFCIDRAAYIDFPAGSMFWARVSSLRPLYDLDLRLEDFPEESGQVDGTLQHAVERMLAYVVQQQGQLLGILPQDGTLSLSTEGERNWQAAFDMTPASRIQLSALEARLVTFDIFDTLVTRPFATAQGARAHLAYLAERRLGVGEFPALRARAEARARIAQGRDPTHAEIYEAMAHLQTGLPHAALAELELQHERRMLRPRQGLIEVLPKLAGKRLAALSDMYLPSDKLREVLPPSMDGLFKEWWISCETGHRKDEMATWPMIAATQGVAPGEWLHVGDNEQADIQMPQLQGLLTPVHVLRPSALLDVVPALRGLRHPQGPRASWQEQLWRGLVANRFATLADRDPSSVCPVPRLDAESAGYIVLGPLLLDYVLWLTRVAHRQSVENVLFLSREGHLLKMVFEEAIQHMPVAERIDARYLLVSRRATGLPTLRDAGDLPRLLGGSFNGTLEMLLHARLGDGATDAAKQVLGQQVERDVFLPEMQAEVLSILEPVVPALIDLAAEERSTYLQYWDDQVGAQCAMVADIGYAGSIQVNLSRLVGRPLGGAYLALRKAASQVEAHGWAEARHHDARYAPDTGSDILRHDLLLEAMLSAPSGQFTRFARREDSLVPEFAASEISARGRSVLAQVHQGALMFARDACAIVGEDIGQVAFDTASITLPLRYLAEGRWKAGDWLSELATEDLYTGRGKIPAAQ